MQIKDYVKPELLVVAVVLYFIGMWLKQSETVKDKYIPLINGLIGVVIVPSMCLLPAPAVVVRVSHWRFLQRLHRASLWRDYLRM